MNELRNPFSNGKIVAKNYDSKQYHTQKSKRGDKDYVISRSELIEFARCPSRWRRGYKEIDDDEGTKSTDWGSLIDTMLLEPERFADRFAVKPETYPDEKGVDKKWNGNSTWCKNWIAEQGDRTCLKRDDVESGKAAIERLMNDDEVSQIIQSSDKQVYVTAEYKDRETGIVAPVKALIDIVPVSFPNGKCTTLLDLKTAKSANPAYWPKTVNSMGYHVQAAMFLDIYNAASGEERFEFRHIVQENYPPFEVCLNLLSSEFVELGRHAYLSALKKYAKCLAENHCPGYADAFRDKGQVFGNWCLTEPEAYMIV